VSGGEESKRGGGGVRWLGSVVHSGLVLSGESLCMGEEG
jgi:hypothetical protein